MVLGEAALVLWRTSAQGSCLLASVSALHRQELQSAGASLRAESFLDVRPELLGCVLGCRKG